MEMEQQRLSMERMEERLKMLKEMEDRMEQQRLENASLKAMMMEFMRSNGRHPPLMMGQLGWVSVYLLRSRTSYGLCGHIFFLTVCEILI